MNDCSNWTLCAAVLCRGIFCLLSIGFAAFAEKPQEDINDLLPRFPIGFWNAATIERFTPDAVKDWADAGITVAGGPYFDSADPQQRALMQAILDRADKEGIKVLLNDSQLVISSPQIPDDYRQRVQKASSELGAHPAVLGWYVRDEPEKAYYDAVCSAARIIREVCPKQIPYINLFPMVEDTKRRVGFDDWDKYLDDFLDKSNLNYLSYDCYSQMSPDPQGVSVYFENLRVYRNAARKHQIPFWTFVLSCSHFNFKAPNEDLIRWQFNTSIAYGAKGIFWFLFYMPDSPYENFRLSPIDEFGERTPLFDSIRRVNRNFIRRYGKLFLDMELQSVGHWPEDKIPQGCEQFSDKTIISSIETLDRVPMIIARFKHRDGGNWLVLVNNSMDQSTQYRAGLTNTKSRVWEMDYQNRLIACSTSTSWDESDNRDKQGLFLVRWLAPGQMDVYKIEPETKD